MRNGVPVEAPDSLTAYQFGSCSGFEPYKVVVWIVIQEELAAALSPHPIEIKWRGTDVYFSADFMACNGELPKEKGVPIRTLSERDCFDIRGREEDAIRNA